MQVPLPGNERNNSNVLVHLIETYKLVNSCFLGEIDPRFKILQTAFEEFIARISDILWAHSLFQQFRKFDSQDFEISQKYLSKMI